MTAKKQPLSHDSLAARYEALVAGRKIIDDDAQRNVLRQLQALLDSFAPAPKKFRLFGKSKPKEILSSLYIWGSVGRGKSMLMDLFFDAAPVANKRRVHFHAFMQEVHARIHKLRQSGAGDPVALLARELADEHSLLCFDELQATDVADASLLFRLFEGVFERGVSVVSTSNHPPSSLYTGGVQAERFDKFITLLEGQMDIAALSSPEDYRYLQGEPTQKTYICPLGAQADAFVESVVSSKTKTQETLAVQGRKLPFTAYDGSMGRFTFHELCETALGPADYLALAKRLKTLILTDIPRLPPEKRNEAKRFVTLIDTLYEHKVKLIATAATPPEGIYTDGHGAFEFHRTVSRLVEMQSGNYLGKQND